MVNYEEEVTKRINIGIALLRWEFITKEGKFNVKKYEKAIENFYNTINEFKIAPLEEFFIIGIEHFHELNKSHQKMLKKIRKKSIDLEIKAFPSFLEKIIREFKKIEERRPKRKTSKK